MNHSEEINDLISQARSNAFTEPDLAIQKINTAIAKAESENEMESLAKALETKGTLSINMQHTDDALISYKRAAELWKQANRSADYLHALNSLAIAHMLQCDWVESETLLTECLKKSIETEDENLHAISLSNFANLYIRQNNFEKAVEFSVGAISILRRLKQNERLLPAVINLGVVYGFLKDDDKALEIYESALDVLENCADKNNVVNLYVNLGELYVRRNENEKALSLLLNANALAKQYQYQRGIAYTASTLGNIYAQQNETALAFDYMLQAQNLLESLNDNFVLPQLYLDTAKFLLKSGDTEKAIIHLQNAYAVAQKNQLHYLQMETCAKFAEAHKQLNNYETAFNYLNEMVELREKIFTEEKAKSIAELQTKYEVEQKNREAEQLRSEAAEFNIKFLRSQMNPHFIFNSVNSINNFILKKDSKQASEYLLRFAKLMRAILDNSSQQFISLEKEIQFLKDYLTLESLRFNIPFEFIFETDEALEDEDALIPPMLLQPYIENAIWHGIAHKQSKGTIKISFKHKKESLICAIEDDGVGRKKSAELEAGNKKHESKAMKIIEERLKILNRGKEKYEAVVIDLFDAKQNAIGTRVEIKLPIEIDH